MTLTRTTSTLGALALGGVLVASTYGASPSPAAPGHTRSAQHHVVPAGQFQAPAAHKYGTNGMRLGLHCETKDMS